MRAIHLRELGEIGGRKGLTCGIGWIWVLVVLLSGCASVPNVSSSSQRGAEQPKANRLFGAVVQVFSEAGLQVAVRDPESRTVVSKWHVIGDHIRHRFSVQVQSLQRSARGREQIALRVESQYQRRQGSTTEGVWQAATDDRSFQRRSKEDERRFAEMIQGRYHGAR